MELPWILNVNPYHALKTIVPRQLPFCKRVNLFHELGTAKPKSNASGSHALLLFL
jgi:hypothetical protein